MSWFHEHKRLTAAIIALTAIVIFGALVIHSSYSRSYASLQGIEITNSD